MTILAIEASTYTGSVAVVRDGAVVAEREAVMRGEHAERLMPAIVDALREAATEPGAIERVVCGAGPGSFTSLRIAGAIAKGIAMAADAPLFGVSSLFLIVAGARPTLAPGRYLAAVDAMRGDLFAAVFTRGDQSIATEGDTVIVPRGELAALARARSARVVGPEETPAVHPHARGAAALGTMTPWPAPADLARWEPDYGRVAEAQARWEAAHGRALAGP